jgi:hypothetical protein
MNGHDIRQLQPCRREVAKTIRDDAKPLSRQEGIRFWSDRDLKAGDWELQIEQAMRGAVAAVLLVSDNFLASDYIVQRELPYLLRANRDRNLMIIWAYLDPCDIKRYPEITACDGTYSLRAAENERRRSWRIVDEAEKLTGIM